MKPGLEQTRVPSDSNSSSASMDSSLNTSSTSNSLLERANIGDSTAWQRIVQLYGPLIYSWGRRAGLGKEDASDVVQETFLVISKQLPRYDSNRVDATFRGWLWTIVKHKIIDLARQRGEAVARGGSTHLNRLQEIAEDQSQFLEQSPYREQQDRSTTISRALQIMRNHFEPTTWRAFWRTTIDGISPNEVAEELGLTRWNVYKARARVLHRLRKDLAGLETLP